MPRPLTRRRLRQTPSIAARTGLSTRTRLALATLIPVSVDALETSQSVVYDNHFITDGSGAKHDFGIHNLQLSAPSGGRFAAGTVGSVGWTLWASGSSPPIQLPALRLGQRVVTTLLLTPGFQVLTADDLYLHPEWKAEANACAANCTLHTNADGSLTIRSSHTYTSGTDARRRQTLTAPLRREVTLKCANRRAGRRLPIRRKSLNRAPEPIVRQLQSPHQV